MESNGLNPTNTALLVYVWCVLAQSSLSLNLLSFVGLLLFFAAAVPLFLMPYDCGVRLIVVFVRVIYRVIYRVNIVLISCYRGISGDLSRFELGYP